MMLLFAFPVITDSMLRQSLVTKNAKCKEIRLGLNCYWEGGSNLSFEVVTKEAFMQDFIAIPQATQKSANRCIAQLMRDPFNTPNVKRILKHQYNNVYRVRLGDYRLVYAVGNQIISLLAIGRRGEIYDRYLGDTEVAITAQDVQDGAPRPIQNFSTTPYDQGRITYPEGPDQFTPEQQELADETGGAFGDLLDRWQIPLEQQELIRSCRNFEEIFQLDLPEETQKKVLHWFTPPTLKQLEEQPDLSVPTVADLERFTDGTLTRFLLKLSPEQERVAARSLLGPALVKGGPGTGKSLVALYRVKNLVDPAQYKLFEPIPRILFLTYGKSLMNASKQLLEELVSEGLKQVEITNIDTLVRKIIVACEGEAFFAPISQLDEYVQEAQNLVLTRRENQPSAAWFTLADLRPNYLVDEIGWVIEGRRIRTLEQYLETERIGRGVPFGVALRTLVWEVYEETLKLTEDKGRSWEFYRGLSLDILQERRVPFAQYDVVIVDEAQDLSPVALGVCAELCNTPQGLFFTADANQSIYNRGFSWSKVHEFLDFRGRSTILRHNYRSTQQIAKASVDFLTQADTDGETVITQAIHRGPQPQVHFCLTNEEQYERLAAFLRQSAQELRLPVWTGTVLTFSNRQATDVAQILNELGIPAKHVKGEELHLKEKVVKVMTLHTSKGLEFPTVAIAHVEKDYFPGIKEGLTDQGEIMEQEASRQKLLFVGCSRAMRRLALFTTADNASPFLSDLQSEKWEFVL